MGGKINFIVESITPFHAIRTITLIPGNFYNRHDVALGLSCPSLGCYSVAQERMDDCFAASRIDFQILASSTL